VLDRLVGDLLDAVDQPLLEPLRLLPGEGRDQDVVDPVVLDRVLDRRERRRAHRLAGRIDVGAVELGERPGEPVGNLLAAEIARARADDRVAVGSLGAAPLEVRDEVGAGDRLRADDERVRDVPAHRIVVDPDRNMGDGEVGSRLRPFDEIAPQDSEPRLIEA
jgi:hypothetical protein